MKLPRISWPAVLETLRTGPDFTRSERIWGRLLFAVVLWSIYASLAEKVVSLRGVPDPVGIATVLSWFREDGERALLVFTNPEALLRLRILLFILLGFYVAGRGLAIVLPAIWIVIMGPATLAQSQDADTHNLQVAGLVLTGQTVWAILGAIQARRLHPGPEYYRQFMWISLQIVVATYLVTGITKMWASEGAWIKNAKYFPIQLEKTRMSDYYNNLEEPGQEVIEAKGWERAPAWVDHQFELLSLRIEAFLKDSPTWSRIFMAGGLFLEFAAVLALLGRRWSLALGLMLIAFHLTISRIMNLHFNVNMYCLAIFLVNVPYWAGEISQRVKFLAARRVQSSQALQNEGPLE